MEHLGLPTQPARLAPAARDRTPRRSGNTIDLYTTFPWEALCAEVAKLQVKHQERGQFGRLRG